MTPTPRPFGEQQLRDALFELADHESESIEELPETQKNEFGEVVHGFNKTQRKLMQVMERRTQAEEAAKAAKVSAETALANLQTAQQSLVQAEKMASLGSITSTIAHEVNNAINFVKGGITNLKINLDNFNEILEVYEQMEIEGETKFHTNKNKIVSLKKELQYEELKEDIVLMIKV